MTPPTGTTGGARGGRDRSPSKHVHATSMGRQGPPPTATLTGGRDVTQGPLGDVGRIRGQVGDLTGH